MITQPTEAEEAEDKALESLLESFEAYIAETPARERGNEDLRMKEQTVTLTTILADEPDEPAENDFYFGACPECKEQDTSCYLNIGKDHWIYCDKHRVCWPIGYNLFSSWQEETEEDWERNRQQLKDYRVVEPWHPSKSA